MTQLNMIKTRRAQPNPFKVGDKVTCELFPDMVLTILEIQRNTALVQSPRGNKHWLALYRLRKA
jgi:hypothetical protein